MEKSNLCCEFSVIKKQLGSQQCSLKAPIMQVTAFACEVLLDAGKVIAWKLP